MTIVCVHVFFSISRWSSLNSFVLCQPRSYYFHVETHTHGDYLVIRSRSSFTNHNISAIRFLLNIIFISPLRSPIETHDCNLMALMSI